MATKIIKIFRPHIELRVFVSDEMQKDYKECYKAVESNYEFGKECKQCSWYESKIGDTHMCEFKEIEVLLEDKD